MANETAMNMEQSRPKAKKRKTLAVETDFIEADLMWFKDKSAVDSPIGLQGTHTADLTTAGSAGADVASSRVPTKPAAAAALVVRTPDVASPGPSNQSAAVLSTRDASVPLQDVVRPASSSRILTEDNTSVASAHVSPGSPVILGPSITRREPSSASPGVSSHGPENAHFATGEVLPSPLPTKKSKKRKRGPPGLKILPMLPTGSPRDILALEGSTDNTSAPVLTEESLETLTSTSFPLPHPVASASESQSNVSLEVREHPASSHMLEEVIPAVDTPTTMSMDELSRPTDGEDSSGDAEMKDPASSTPDQATTSPLPLFLPSSSQTSLYTPSARRSELDLNRSTTTLSASSSSSSIDTQAMVTVEDRVAESSPQTDALDEASASAPPAPVDTEIEPPDPQTPFANTSARVLSMVRGASSMTPASRPVVGDFELTMEELVQIARWNDRSRLSDDLSKTLCVSFVSYLVAQCVDASVGESQEVYDVDRCGPPASWPQDGTAFVVVNDGQSADRFIVSPPFITTVDKCIDLGTRSLRPGPNTLHLFQYRDHSDRFFVTLLHHPTRAQLAELQSARNKDREWQRFVEGLGRIELRVPRLFPSPPLNENFVSHS
ncbi:hypothetical protein C8Q78DRAFT_799740 [Trametes maxima]|nr:hypothetical protein C8Q78DRAFT_799740 [Trametes maxima]